MDLTFRELARAGAVAAAVSGLPSTLWAAGSGRPLLEATWAAGTLLPGRQQRPGFVAGMATHLAVSAAWTAAFALVSRRYQFNAISGAAAGLAVAALDLGIVGRHYPAIAAIPQVPQWADHAVFGAVLGHMLGCRAE